MKVFLRANCITILILVAGFFVSSCTKKENIAPTLYLKTGGAYTSTNVTVSPGATILIGVIADQGSDPLHLLYSEVGYDGANVDSLYTRYWVPVGSEAHYEQDFQITVRNQTGTERWKFTINDKDGRLTEKEIRISVQ